MKTLEFCLLLLGGLVSSRLQPGDRIPTTDHFDVFQVPGNQLILLLHSGKENSIRFFEELTLALAKQRNLSFFLVDVNPNPDERVHMAFAALEGTKACMVDANRVIYSEFGVIILPTLFLVNGEQVIHSVLVGYTPNLRAQIEAQLTALIKGQKPENFYQEAARKKNRNRLQSLGKRGFRLFNRQNFILALESFEQSLELDPSYEEALLGKGYSLLFSGRTVEGLDLFAQHGEGHGSKRFHFAHALAKSMVSGDEAALSQLANLCSFEPRYFTVIVYAANLLERAGMCADALTVIRQAYEVLQKQKGKAD